MNKTTGMESEATTVPRAKRASASRLMGGIQRLTAITATFVYVASQEELAQSHSLYHVLISQEEPGRKKEFTSNA